jgi:hypothetical protein
MELPILPPHPAVYLSEPRALAEYLRERGLKYRRRDHVTILLDIGEGILFGIAAFWLDDQVRFVAQSALAVDETKLAEIALAVERLNAEIGFPVWRVIPSLSATYTVTLDHTGALSSRALEYAIALIGLALVRDRPRLREIPGVHLP